MALPHNLTIPPKSPPKSNTITSPSKLMTLTSPPRSYSITSSTCSRLIKAPRNSHPKTQITSPPKARPIIQITSPISPPPIRRSTAPTPATSAPYYFSSTTRAQNDLHFGNAFVSSTLKLKRARSFTFTANTSGPIKIEEESVGGIGSLTSSSSVDPWDHESFSSVYDANVYMFSQVQVEDDLRTGANRFHKIPFRTQTVETTSLNAASSTSTTTTTTDSTTTTTTAYNEQKKEEGGISKIPRYFSHHGQRLRLQHDQCFLALKLLDQCESYAHLISQLQMRVYKHYVKTGVLLKTTGNIIRVTRYIYID